MKNKEVDRVCPYGREAYICFYNYQDDDGRYVCGSAIRHDCRIERIVPNFKSKYLKEKGLSNIVLPTIVIQQNE